MNIPRSFKLKNTRNDFMNEEYSRGKIKNNGNNSNKISFICVVCNYAGALCIFLFKLAQLAISLFEVFVYDIAESNNYVGLGTNYIFEDISTHH